MINIINTLEVVTIKVLPQKSILPEFDIIDVFHVVIIDVLSK